MKISKTKAFRNYTEGNELTSLINYIIHFSRTNRNFTKVVTRDERH